MSHTEQDVFFRWVLVAGQDPDALRARLGELGERLLAGGRRSPDGRCVDVDFAWELRSQYPLVGAEDALFHGSESVEAIWIRARSGFNSSTLLNDDDVDGINQIDVHCDRIAIDGWRPCRYGFDEIQVHRATARLPELTLDGDVQYWRGAGSYLTRNCSASMLARFEPLPGDELARSEPIDALALLSDTPFASVEWRWRGRVVHRVTGRDGRPDHHPFRESSTVQHETGDGWDNCIDDVYLLRFGDPELRRPPAVYEGDRYSGSHIELDDA